MNWTVVWRPVTQNDLATLWLNATDRNAVQQAADAIDARLERDPYAFSESRDGASRVMLVPPLGVYYDVDDANRVVIVLAVWEIK